MEAGAAECTIEDSPAPTTGPRRRCFVTRREADRNQLIRFVVDPRGEIVADVAATLPGRGLWLSADRDVVNTACVRNTFVKAFKAEVAVEARLADRVEHLLARRCLDVLGLARRAGVLVAGFEKVRAMLASDACGMLVVAADAGADGRRRFAGVGRHMPLVSLFTAAELSAALGREHVVYAALRKGRMAERFAVETARLAGFRRADDTGFPESPSEEDG